MALFETHFYHGTINLYTSVFGTLFNKLSICHYNDTGDKIIRVPLIYAGEQKNNNRNDSREELDSLKYKMKLPMAAFYFSGLVKDTGRVTNKFNKLAGQTVNNSKPTQYNRVPYNFNYSLVVRTKYHDDLLQLVEQITPYFNPSISVTVNDNKDISGSTPLNITLTDISYRNDYEGSYEDSQTFEAEFNFILEGWLYTKTEETKQITTIELNYHDLVSLELDSTDIIESSE